MIKSDTRGIPLIAIVGRPNVGKSTLFNRVIKKRKAITDPTPGVTRDPIEEHIVLNRREVLLADTGGYKIEKEGLDEAVVLKSIGYLDRADLILFLVDVTDLTPEDESFIELLRPYTEKTLMVVNKVDSPERENDIWNYASLGFSDLCGVSAAHNRNLDVLYNKILERLPEYGSAAPARVEAREDVRVSILGKPNTGKSTLLNILIGEDRSIVSDIPGTTRDPIEGKFTYKTQTFSVVDTAGIRRKNRVYDNVEYYSVNRAIKSIEDAELVFLVIDAEQGLSEQDKKIAAQIVKRGRGVILVLNKWDLLPEVSNQFNAIKDRIDFVFPVLSFAPVVPMSAKNGTGIQELLKTALNVQKQLRTKVETPVFNKKLQEWTTQNPPPLNKQHRQFKVRYGVQTSVSPLEFVIFVNRKRGFPDFYVRYLQNKMRKELNLSQVPFEVHLRES